MQRCSNLGILGDDQLRCLGPPRCSYPLAQCWCSGLTAPHPDHFDWMGVAAWTAKMAKIMDPILPILSILGYRAIILGSFGGPGAPKGTQFQTLSLSESRNNKAGMNGHFLGLHSNFTKWPDAFAVVDDVPFCPLRSSVLLPNLYSSHVIRYLPASPYPKLLEVSKQP